MAKQNNTTRSFRSYVTNNLLLKIVSLIFAIILWSFVTNSTNPDRTKTLRDVPVVLQGLEALEEKGLTVRDDIEKLLPSVKVKVNVKNSDYKNVDKNVVFASIDVSEISKDGPNSISVTPSFSNLVDVSLISVEPQAINVTIDKILEKEVPVTINQTGTLKDGLVSVNPEYSKTVTVKGSSYYVELISDAVVDIDLSTLKDGDTVSKICRFTDNNGNNINFNGTRIDIDMDIQSKKEVSISTVDAVTNANKLATGYEFESVSAGKVIVCGHAGVLQDITEVKIKPIDLKGKDATFTASPADFILPEGITLFDGQSTPNIKVHIVPKKKSITVKRTITVSGLGENLTATVTSGNQTVNVKNNGTIKINASITLTGSGFVLDSLTETDIIVKLSLDNKGAGSYELTPTVSLSASIASEVSAQLVSPAQVSVSIK